MSAGKSIELFINSRIHSGMLPEPLIEICFVPEPEIVENFAADLFLQKRFCPFDYDCIVGGEDRLPFAPPVSLADQRKTSAEAYFQLFLYLCMLDPVPRKYFMYFFAEIGIGY